jgi:hypothetical protein
MNGATLPQSLDQRHHWKRMRAWRERAIYDATYLLRMVQVDLSLVKASGGGSLCYHGQAQVSIGEEG